jgi:mannan endo-1,4-beta-mannosidase
MMRTGAVAIVLLGVAGLLLSSCSDDEESPAPGTSVGGSGGDVGGSGGTSAGTSAGTGGATGGDGGGGGGAVEPRDTFYVDGSTLRDPCGEEVVLRGANKGSAFPNDTDQTYLPGLEQTGANAVRFTFRVQYNNSSAEDVDTALQAAADNHMVAIPALWDATGDWSQLGFAVDYWLDPAMVAVLQQHEAHTLLNIANEPGTSSVTDDQFRTEYSDAISRLRAAGLHMPIVIDAANWGRNEDYILDNGVYLLQQDPDQNVIFSWHPWDTQQPASRYEDAFDGAQALGLCLIVGEFSSVGVNYNNPIDYQSIMQLAEQKGIGWLWWWWRSSDGHALTSDGIYGNWANVGEEVVVTSAHGIEHTSVRSHFLTNGTCN